MSAAFRACALVPTYDNPRTVRSVVQGLRRHLPDVILVDDGSATEGRAACDAIAADGLALLVRHSRNTGKGAAVMAGFAAAHARGYTHAFQVDADGQHDLSAVPAFLAAGAERPDALVVAHPLYDESAPRSRLFARSLTAWCVGIELGRRDRMRDAMIGFRLYPVPAALASGTRGNRMEFDIEIAVRMVRRGTPVVDLPVHVRYLAPEAGGVSHFALVADNLRFFRMHTRLCTSGLADWARALLGLDGVAGADAATDADAAEGAGRGGRR
jgi:glycosyltransferase involved in cell wall biosynthesis